MEASNMLDVLHYFFEEDLFYSSAEQAEGRDRSRVAIYEDFYKSSYVYSTSFSSTAGGQAASKNFDDFELISEEKEEEKIVPFDPLQKQKAVKPFIRPTNVNAAASQPFGDMLDGPITRG
jgi:hypothetical protein